MGDVEAEVEAQCAQLCRPIGDEVAKSACYDGRSYWCLKQLALVVMEVIRNVCCLYVVHSC